MKARRVALLLGVLLVVYLVVTAERGVRLVADGRPVVVLLGLGVLVLPAIGGWILVNEMRFGRAVERLGRELAENGELPEDERVLLPSGRPDRAAADAVFERRRAQTEVSPQDWRVWFRLGVAYGDAGDTHRGRRAMRRAIALHDRASR